MLGLVVVDDVDEEGGVSGDPDQEDQHVDRDGGEQLGLVAPRLQHLARVGNHGLVAVRAELLPVLEKTVLTLGLCLW